MCAAIRCPHAAALEILHELPEPWSAAICSPYAQCIMHHAPLLSVGARISELYLMANSTTARADRC